MELIDKEKVIEEIERIKKEECPTDTYEGRCKMLWFEQFSSFLNTLEVKEVDLVEEIDYKDYIRFFKEHPEYNNVSWGFEETWTFAQYCYKLGLNAWKGE